MAIDISLKTLIETGAHFGHQVRRWNPRMEQYIYGEQDGVHIFDLTKTKTALQEVLELLERNSKEGKTILLVGTKKQVKDKVKEVAQASGIFYVNERWLGGTLSNFEQIKKSAGKLTEMKKNMEEGVYNKYTKKERLLLEREIERLRRFFSGIEGIKKLPDLLIVIDIKREKGAVTEAVEKGVEVAAIVDTNSDPTLVDYPIPMNDDATKALEYVLDLMRDAILKGKGKASDKKELPSIKKESKKKSS